MLSSYLYFNTSDFEVFDNTFALLSYLTTAKVVLIPDSEEMLRAEVIAIERRLLAPLNMNSTLSHLFDDGDEIFFNIL